MLSEIQMIDNRIVSIQKTINESKMKIQTESSIPSKSMKTIRQLSVMVTKLNDEIADLIKKKEDLQKTP